MGYTHYWTPQRPINKEELAFIKEVVNTTEVAICGGCGESGTEPELTLDRIWFNGEGEDSHETFGISADSLRWDFCKTAMKPYDEVVVAILSELNKTGALKWTSDGDSKYGDFDAGLKLRYEVLAKLK
jgi:hypothetical protein